MLSLLPHFMYSHRSPTTFICIYNYLKYVNTFFCFRLVLNIWCPSSPDRGADIWSYWSATSNFSFSGSPLYCHGKAFPDSYISPSLDSVLYIPTYIQLCLHLHLTAKTRVLQEFWDLEHRVSPQVVSFIALWLTGEFLTGIAELLIFHPVDTVAKRLMSNKAKVCRRVLNYSGYWPHMYTMCCRFPSRLCRPLFSGTLQLNLLQQNSYHYSLVSDTLQATRLRNGCTNSVVNHGSTTSSTNTTNPTFQVPLGNGRGRWWCKLLLEGV